MKKKKIDFNTQILIRKYMHFHWDQEEKHTSKSELELFNKLTDNLKSTFLEQTTGKILFPLEIFTKNFSQEFLRKVLFIMKPVAFDPNSFIFQVLITFIFFF